MDVESEDYSDDGGMSRISGLKKGGLRRGTEKWFEWEGGRAGR